jgi:AAA+ superfamily predicted ATPase
MMLLAGPGGAGKTMAGAGLAERLGLAFVDLDAAFAARQHFGHSRCARLRRLRAAERGPYTSLINGLGGHGVMALSSGFMTYRDDVHPAYALLRAIP